MRNKIKNLITLKKIVKQLRRRNKTVVFTNGCFDLLHTGHVRLLEKCKRLGDYLVVAVNADRSVKRIKGAGRPVVPEQERAEVCAALGSVDYVVLFTEDTPVRILQELKPDILVKGGDWTMNTIVGRTIVKRVVRFPLIKGRSTTAIIRKIKKLSFSN